MKIRGIRINGFGNLIDKEYEFKDGVNLIKGNNESGKSTIMGFFNSIFFGIQKTRKKDVISDDVRYMPWDTSEFSGFMQYKLDNGETYTVFRDFNTKKISILNEANQDIFKKYSVDKEIGSKFLEEQTGVDKASFSLSSYTMQNSVVLNSTDKSQMVQKLSNLISTGEDNISYKNLYKKIQDKRREEVGTNKTLNMPINKVDKRLFSVRQELRSIKEKANENSNITQEEKEIKEKFRNLECKRDLLMKLKSNTVKGDSSTEMLESLKENIRKKQDGIREKLELKHDVIEKESLIKKNSKTYLGISVIAVILEILVAIILKYVFKVELIERIIYSLLPVPIIAILAILFVTFKDKIKIDSDHNQKSEENRELEKEINIIKKEILNQEKEIAKLDKQKTTEEKRFQQNLIAEFCGNVEDDYLNNILKYDLEKLEKEAKEVESDYTKTMYSLSTVDAKKDIVSKNTEKIATLEEKLNNLELEKEELEDLNEVYEIVLSGLESAYNEMQDSISPSFVNNLSQITKHITDGKYKSVVLSEDQKIMVQLSTGEYIELEKLSTGTIEQVNFALRMSILKELTNEKIPVLLDETFVFYDEERLRNTIKYITDIEDRQIILFSCSNREKDILDQNNIEYNYIEMR